MAGDRAGPLRVEWCDAPPGLELVRQPAPAGARSFAATFVAPAGWGYDPRGAGGLARLTAALAISAAGRFDRVEMARRLDRAGGTLSSECAPESSEFTVGGPAEMQEELLAILADVVLRPRFDGEDVARALRQLAERQLRESTQPASRSEREMFRAVFPPGHPYRETGLGDRRSLKALRRARFQAFHAEQYLRGGGTLVVTSPSRRSHIERTARRLFRGVGDDHPPALKFPRTAPPDPAAHVVPMPGRTQVEVRLGGASIRRDDPAYPAAYLANEVLGGRPLLARLFQTVREQAGLAYHASSELEAMRFGGYWMVQAGTGATRWRKVVALVAGELERLRRESVADRELKVVRESAIGSIPLSLESTADAHELAVDVAYHHLAPDHWRTWPDRLREVRPSALREAAEDAFGSRGTVTVAAGTRPASRDG